MNALWLPGSDLGHAAPARYVGSLMTPTKGVLHSTETGTWPDYKGGASAPNLTALWSNGTLQVRSHFPLNMSSRALKNLAGGVQTNTSGVVQIELVGTCDRGFARKYGYLYIPEAPDAWYVAVARLMRQIEAATGIPRIATQRPWLAYPQSYGNSPARMGFAEWDRFKGWCGHQHVPENDHGDPGNIDINRLINVGGDATPSKEDDMPLTPKDYDVFAPGIQRDIQDGVLRVVRSEGISGAAVLSREAIARVAGLEAQVHAMAAGSGLDADTLQASVRAAVSDALGNLKVTVEPEAQA